VLQATPAALGVTVTLSITNAVPSTPGLLFASAPAAVPLPIGGGCSVYLDLASLTELFPFTTSATGAWSTSVLVPSDAGLVGAQFALQAVVLPTAGPLGLDLSNGLLITVEP
jgi:hypothetical protein